MTTAAPITGIDPASVHREVLPNGLTVLVRRDPSTPVVAIVTYVKAGYFDETDDVVGIAHVLEHMYFKGTPQRGVGEIAKATKSEGGYLNASTIYDHTVYYTVLPSAGFAAGLAIQADAYANSSIDADELRRELEVIIQEAKRKADNPSSVTVESLYALLHERHRMRRWRIGREPGLRRLTRDDLVRFYRNFYRPSTTVLSIVGDVDIDAAMREVSLRYGSLTDAPVVRDPGPAEADWRGFRYQELAGDIAQPELAIGWRTIGSLHDDSPALDALASVLGAGRGSRLYQRVREQQLVASVSAHHYTPTEVGVFVAHAEARDTTTAEAVAAIWREIALARDGGVDDGELERTRRIFESSWLRRLETMEGQANHLAEWEALGDWRLGEQYFDRMMAVTGADIAEVAERYLAPDRAAVLVYRPERLPVVFADAAAAEGRLTEATEGGAAAKPQPGTPSIAVERAVPSAVVSAVALEREEGRVRVYRTRAGVPILIRRRPGAPIVHLGVYALGGVTAESASQSGITTLVTRASVKGTERRSASLIAGESELLGGTIAGTVRSDGFGWTFSVPVTRVGAAVELLADVVQHPTFPDDAVETERAVALANLATLRDDMYGYPVRLALESGYAGHPYGASTIGREEALRSIGADAVREWHATAAMSAPSVIVLAGDVDADETAALLAAHFDRLTWRDAPAILTPTWAAGTTNVERREKAQTALALAYPGPARPDAARIVTAMIAGVASGLGGRFFDELRDRQSLCYTVQAFTSERRLGGLFITYIATSPDKEEVARHGLLGEMARLRDELVTEEELARAKRYAIGTHAIRQQSGAAVLTDIMDAWLYGAGLADLERFDERVGAVTAAEMQRLARRDFDPDLRVEGIVRGIGKQV
jgi:zinc protease